MRKSFALAAVLAFALAPGLEAQVVLGFGGGVRLASMSFDPDIEELDESRTGFGGVAFVGIPLSETFRIQPGIGYTQKGTKGTEDGFEATLELDYFEVPVLGVLSPQSNGPVGFHLFAGPTFGIEAGCSITEKEDGTSDNYDCEDDGINTKSLDIGVLFGAAVSFATSETMSIWLSAGYGLGLTNIVDDSEDTAKNRAIAIDVGLAFRPGG